MASIKEIKDLELENSDRIYLHREGLFWKACERSAFRFVIHYTGYKVSKRHFKVIGGDMVSLGFPDAVLRKLFAPDMLHKVDEKQYYVLCDPIDETDYEQWRAAIPLEELRVKSGELRVQLEEKAATPVPRQLTELERMILEFDLNREPPLACMNFVQKLKLSLIMNYESKIDEVNYEL